MNFHDIERDRKTKDKLTKSIARLRSKAENVKDYFEREDIRNRVQEEERQISNLEGIIDFLARPGNWLENSEWYHREDY